MGTKTIVTTEMTFSGVTPSNFEGIKDELTKTVATVLRVDSSAVELSLKSLISRKRSNGMVVVLTITSTRAVEVDDVKNHINSSDFVSNVNTEVSNSPALVSANVTLVGATEPTANVVTGKQWQ